MKVCLECGTRFETRDWRCPQCGRRPAEDTYLRFTATDDSAADNFPQGAFADLAEQEQRSFWFRSRNELIGWALRTYFPEAHSFFELGCGTGVVLAALHARRPELDLAGGEPSKAGLDVAKTRVPDVPLYLIDGRHLPFEQEFDVVGAFDVLEHVDRDDAVLRQMHQATRSNGGVLLTVPQHRWLWSAVDEFSRHQRRYRSEELVEKVESAGFRVLRKTSFMTLLLPAVTLSRWRYRGKSNYDPATEYRLPRAVEGLFERTMTFERKLIGSGVSLPAGSSLLVVAERV